MGDWELDDDNVLRLEIDPDELSDGLAVTECDADVDPLDTSERDRNPVILPETVGVNVLVTVFLMNESVAVALEVVDTVPESVCVLVWLADLLTVVVAVWVLDTDVDAETVFVLTILPVILGLPDIDSVTLAVFETKGLPVFVTLAVLVFDTSELLVCVTEAVVVLDDNELLV